MGFFICQWFNKKKIQSIPPVYVVNGQVSDQKKVTNKSGLIRVCHFKLETLYRQVTNKVQHSNKKDDHQALNCAFPACFQVLPSIIWRDHGHHLSDIVLRLVGNRGAAEQCLSHTTSNKFTLLRCLLRKLNTMKYRTRSVAWYMS